MKKLIIISLFMLSTTSFAGEAVIWAGQMSPFVDSYNADIQVDFATNEAFVRITSFEHETYHPADRDYHGNFGGLSTLPMPRVAGVSRVRIEGLNLEGDKLIFRPASGDAIDCADLGQTRILRKPTLRMSGRCKAEIRFGRINGERIVQAVFITK